MTTVKSTDINYNDNALDLSTGLSETEEIKKAIEQAESAMAAPAAAKPLVPTKKAAKRFCGLTGIVNLKFILI